MSKKTEQTRLDTRVDTRSIGDLADPWDAFMEGDISYDDLPDDMKVAGRDFLHALGSKCETPKSEVEKKIAESIEGLKSLLAGDTTVLNRP
jgi:hypothetical protein